MAVIYCNKCARSRKRTIQSFSMWALSVALERYCLLGVLESALASLAENRTSFCQRIEMRDIGISNYDWLQN